MAEDTSPLLEDSVPVELSPLYSEADRTYLQNLQRRLEDAHRIRESVHDEFDGMTYSRFCEENRKNANTYIEPKKNREDTTFVTGTTRQKLLSYLAQINNLDLSADIQAFDKDNALVAGLGENMEDLIEKTEELDHDQEKKLLRQYTLLEQGTVFVDEVWDVRMRLSKKPTFDMRAYRGAHSSATWKARMERVFNGPSRNVLKNENVFLGDIMKFFIQSQPYLYTLEEMSYEEAEAIYGGWERWKYVPRTIKRAVEQERSLYNRTWTLTDLQQDRVEVIKYQDKWNDEFQIIINGVLMLPVGFPMPWRYCEYNIEKQVFEVISPFFAYGKSLPMRLRTTQGLIDEMLRLAILKTQKSFMPPRGNLSGRAISSRVFYPGKITPGIKPVEIPPLEEAQGVTNSEFSMIELMFRNLDENSVDRTFTGQQPQGSPTATQILQVQQQAERMFGITVFVASMLEKKVAQLRLMNLLENWFDPVDTQVDAAREHLIEKYRSIALMKHLDGAGFGRKIIRLAKDAPAPEEVLREEEQMSTPDMPVRIHYLNPDIMKRARYEWYITVTPKQRRSSNLAKILFDEMSQRARQFGNVNEEYLAERFAQVWEEPPAKLFKSAAEMPATVEPQSSQTAPAVRQLENQPSLGALTGTRSL